MIARLFKLFLLAIILLVAVKYCKTKRYPPGVLIKNDPHQTSVQNIRRVCGNDKGFEKSGYIYNPLASFRIQARVLGMKRYYSYSGPAAIVAPYDLAVGWGPMSDQSVLDQLKISQGNRFYFYEWENQPPLPKAEITSHSTNIHLIPSDEAMERSLKRITAGDLVALSGYLVEVNGADIHGWRSSLSRTDSGNGACEILWVESVEQLNLEDLK